VKGDFKNDLGADEIVEAWFAFWILNSSLDHFK
jgi:hypothetical protein